jgi:hypothetical protein|tara:strand:+ start:1074 stop:1274 length:201 start_codon:yes stop_codon:yes gene_type:complete
MNKQTVQEFYLLALMDIANGKDLYELEQAIEEYEQDEQFEACAGILKAIHESGYLTIKDIIKRIDE